MRIKLGVLRAIILAESRYSDTKSKYPEVDVDQLRAADPSGQKLKYLQWMAKQVSQGNDPEEVIELVSQFHNNVNKMTVKDINSFKTLDDLETAVETAATKQTSREKRSSAKSGAEVLYEDDDITVLYIGTRDACILYGKNTQWCITQQKDDQYWYRYTQGSNSVFYYIIRKKPRRNKYDKVAVRVPRDNDNNPIKGKIEFYSARDDLEQFDKLNKAFRGKLQELIPLITSDAKTRQSSMIAKIVSGEASPEEQLEAVKKYRHVSDVMEDLIPVLTSQAVLDYVLKVIFSKSHPEVISGVINNPNFSDRSLAKFIVQNDDNSKTLWIADEYKGDSKAVWQALLNKKDDTDSGIMYAIARNNLHAPRWVLQQIANHSDDELAASEAKERLESE